MVRLSPPQKAIFADIKKRENPSILIVNNEYWIVSPKQKLHTRLTLAGQFTIGKIVSRGLIELKPTNLQNKFKISLTI